MLEGGIEETSGGLQMRSFVEERGGNLGIEVSHSRSLTLAGQMTGMVFSLGVHNSLAHQE